MLSHGQEESSTYDFIRENDLLQALTAAEGPDAQFDKYEVRDFTKKGDNYLGIITSVAVFYTLHGAPKQTSFILKATPVHASAVYGFAMCVFTKEFDFYSKLVPLLNHELSVIGQPLLQVPKCYHVIERNGGKVLYLEDLRLKDFKLFDRRSPLDLQHMALICKELARLHAAGSLLMKKNCAEGLEIIKLFPSLEDQFSLLKEKNESLTSYEEFFKTFILTGVTAAEINPGYEKVAEFLRQKVTIAHEINDTQRQASPRFLSVCHGDAWNNNFLFRYDSSGVPVECKFLDMQFHRAASVVVDLHHLSYTSVDRDFRRKHWDKVLSIYHSHHTAVMEAAGLGQNFTLNDLQEEFRDKLMYGLMIGLLMAPLVFEVTDEVIDVDVLLKKMSEEDKDKLHQFMLNKLKTNSLLNAHILEIFDELIDARVVT